MYKGLNGANSKNQNQWIWILKKVKSREYIEPLLKHNLWKPIIVSTLIQIILRGHNN
jgi:hypothetical protein